MESAYEVKRRARIVRNHETLALLGISDTAGLIAGIAAGKGQTLKKRKTHAGEGSMAVRKSARLQPRGDAWDTPSESQAEVPFSASVASWEQKVFQEFEQGLPSSQLVWDAHHMHQHLTRSPGGRMVATTGVAGYGAALCINA